MDTLEIIERFALPSNKIGNYESVPFIELPYGVVMLEVPGCKSSIEAVEIVMKCQFPDFDIEEQSQGELVSFMLWIKEQQEFIHKIEELYLSSEPDAEMLAAGAHRLNEFGAYATVDSLAGGNILKHDEIKKLPYFKVYEKLKLDKVNREIQKAYNEIIKNKK